MKLWTFETEMFFSYFNFNGWKNLMWAVIITTSYGFQTPPKPVILIFFLSFRSALLNKQTNKNLFSKAQPQMATQEDPEPTSSHGPAESVAAYGSIPSGKAGEASQEAPSQQAIKGQIEAGRGGEASLVIHPTPSTATHRQEAAHHPGASPWGAKGS